MLRLKAPQERKPIAHGASRGRTATFTKPRHGAKVAALPSSAPSGGCSAHGSFPRLAPWAIGFRPNGLEEFPCVLAAFGSLRVSPESRIPPFLCRAPHCHLRGANGRVAHASACSRGLQPTVWRSSADGELKLATAR